MTLNSIKIIKLCKKMNCSVDFFLKFDIMKIILSNLLVVLKGWTCIEIKGKDPSEICRIFRKDF